MNGGEAKALPLAVMRSRVYVPECKCMLRKIVSVFSVKTGAGKTNGSISILATFSPEPFLIRTFVKVTLSFQFDVLFKLTDKTLGFAFSN